jgi:hypothetical protein
MELLKRDPNTERIFASLEIVKNFIIDKGLILTGGMVIDIATKMKGKIGLYSSEEVPDYDCLSPQFYEDSLELSKLLEGDGVDVISATHVQTLRTRIEYEPIADITLCDRVIFDKIPYLIVPEGFNEAGMKIIHPHYQIIDQYRSLSYPMEGFPRHVLFNRLKKDLARHDLLLDAYPITADTVEEISGHNISLVLIEEMFNHYQIKTDYLLYGETAYHFITNTKSPNVIELLSDTFTCIDAKHYNRHLDIIPDYLEFEFRGTLFRVFNNLNSKICSHENKICVSSNNVKMYLLFKYHVYNITEYLSYYLKLKDETMLPNLKTMYGKSNKSESYLVAHEDLLSMVEYGKKLNKRFKNFYPKYEDDMDEKILTLINDNKHLYDLLEFKRDGKLIEQTITEISKI